MMVVMILIMVVMVMVMVMVMMMIMMMTDVVRCCSGRKWPGFSRRSNWLDHGS